MEKIRCIKLMINRYYVFYPEIEENRLFTPLEVLATFLVDDFSGWYKEWLLSDSDGTGGNVTYLDKEDGNVVLTLSAAVYETDVSFVDSQQEFLEILTTWEKLYKEGWPEIIITQDDSGVHLEGKNSE